MHWKWSFYRKAEWTGRSTSRELLASQPWRFSSAAFPFDKLSSHELKSRSFERIPGKPSYRSEAKALGMRDSRLIYWEKGHPFHCPVPPNGRNMSSWMTWTNVISGRGGVANGIASCVGNILAVGFTISWRVEISAVCTLFLGGADCAWHLGRAWLRRNGNVVALGPSILALSSLGRRPSRPAIVWRQLLIKAQPTTKT